jgi:hypothetical protein
MNLERTQQLMMYSQGVRHSSAFSILWTKVISVQHFVDEGLDIMCRIKKTMGMLDADICEWVKMKKCQI